MLTSSNSTQSRPSDSGPITPLYRLTVRAADGREHKLDIAASNAAEAVRMAAATGVTVQAIDTPGLTESSGKPVQRFPLLLFSQELLSLLDAGLNLTEALATLLAKERHSDTRSALQRILQALSEGKNFSDVLEQNPDCFPEVYVATVRASERTGDLALALSRYVAYQLQFDAIRKKLISAAIYPAMLLAVGGFVALFLLGYVVPKFSMVYESAGRELPYLSMALLGVGKLIYQYWPMVMFGLAVSCIGLVLWVRQPSNRLGLLNQFLRLPWLVKRSEEFRLSRFYRAVGLLLSSGIALPRAMGMVTGLLSPAQQLKLVQGRLAVEHGQSLSAALLAVGLATPVAESLIKVGERSGKLAEMLERTASFHDEEFSRRVDWASRLLEPVLMMAIGLVIGTVVVLMYMPIFELAGSL